jgi:hypothetical protein
VQVSEGLVVVVVGAVFRLMNETTAVALNYGILRPIPEKVTNKVMFIDMGEASTNVAVVAFAQGKLNVLATASERNLGGRDFDLLLVGGALRQCMDEWIGLSCASKEVLSGGMWDVGDRWSTSKRTF